VIDVIERDLKPITLGGFLTICFFSVLSRVIDVIDVIAAFTCGLARPNARGHSSG
jgi:hypothetical protein